MSFLIDRRQNGKNKSAVNRQRFLRRYRAQIRQSVGEKIRQRSITDTDKNESISIPSRDVGEPVFQHGPGGHQVRIYPGNRNFGTGDRIPRPPGGGGGSGRDASNQGEGMDDFVFEISQQEFLDVLFEDMTLPNLAKRQLIDSEETKPMRAGFSNTGSPANISIIRSMRNATARRIAMGAGKRNELRRCQAELKALTQDPLANPQILLDLEERIEQLRQQINRIPFLDDIDLRYHNKIREPIPRAKAVMFCLMDVSGSMDQATKDLAKRFFLLLYLFLSRHYEKTDVVFIRHHTSATEVDEHEFFSSRETGGTVVSSALVLMQEIISQRYSPSEWNIYGAQASDGDNWPEDGARCQDLLNELLPDVQYYAYIEIASGENHLWVSYQPIEDAHPGVFAMQRITGPEDIYPVLQELFRKQPA